MSMLRLENVYKVFPGHGKKAKDVIAVSDFSLDIKDKEFIVFIGPSGCGKSTTLRMIAGLEENTKGNIYIDDELMNGVEPKYRNIAMVFQNYALYPHMTARENMSFGLKNMKVPTPLLDKEGKQVSGIDHKLIKAIKSEIGRLNKKIEKLESMKSEIEQNNKTLEKSTDEKEKENLKNRNERLLNLYDENNLNTFKAKLEKANTDLKHYETTEVPLFKYAHLDKEVIDSRVEEAAKILDIENLLDRKPKAMSGGQRQRVALGRAIVRTPKIFLLDEPLSNLDAKLRAQMRVEIINLYEKLNTPFIYVTHDQVEAMSMGTRIVVLREGVIQQIDSPTNLYDYPSNRFVAGFLGTPQMNFLEVIIKRVSNNLEITIDNNHKISAPLKGLRPLQEEYLDGKEHQAILGIRSEDIAIKDKGDFEMKVGVTEVLGSETLLHMESLSENPFKLVIKSADRIKVSHNQVLSVDINKTKIHLFSNDGKESSIFKKEGQNIHEKC